MQQVDRNVGLALALLQAPTLEEPADAMVVSDGTTVKVGKPVLKLLRLGSLV